MKKAFSITRSASILLLILILMGCGDPNGDQIKMASSSGSGRSEMEHDIFRAFAYHRFGDDRYPSTNISLDQFEEHLQHLKKNDFKVLTFGDALKRVRSNKSSDQKIAVISIDDAYASIKSGALPLLEEYGYPATVFTCTEYVGGNNNLSWDDLKMLKKKGWEIGNHSHSHEHFLNIPKDERKERFRKDLKKAEGLFQEKLGYKPDLYAYPYGEYDESMKEVLQDEGYRGGAAQRSGVIHTNSDPFNLPRFPMTSFYGKPEKFKEKAGMHPLRVLKTTPESPIIQSNNPPELKLTVEKGNIKAENIQCFVDGSDACSKKVEVKGERIEITVKSKKKLKQRRTLYTLTAPDKTGDYWHWYSHLWVQPEKSE